MTSQNSTEQGTFCLFVGDDSGSASELWSITVGNNTYTAPGYGETGSADFTYAVGNCYDITLQHLGTDPAFLANPPSWGYPSGTSGPNYDWDASVTEVGSSVPYWIDDPNSTAPVVGPWGGDQYHLLQQHIWDVIGDPDLTAGKTAYLYVPNINIDTDSNNDGTIDHATDDAVEDQSPGCYVAVHQSGASDLAEADISPLFASAARQRGHGRHARRHQRDFGVCGRRGHATALWSRRLADVDGDGRHSQQGLRGRCESRVRDVDVDALCPGQHDRLRQRELHGSAIAVIHDRR